VLKNVSLGPGKANVVIPAAAYGARRQQPRGELRSTQRTPAPELDQARAREGAAIYGHHRAGGRVDVSNVVLLTSVFVGPEKGAPSRGKREPAITARQVAQVRHGTMIADPAEASVSAP
jgi:hypothetical protein